VAEERLTQKDIEGLGRAMHLFIVKLFDGALPAAVSLSLMSPDYYRSADICLVSCTQLTPVSKRGQDYVKLGMHLFWPGILVNIDMHVRVRVVLLNHLRE